MIVISLYSFDSDFLSFHMISDSHVYDIDIINLVHELIHVLSSKINQLPSYQLLMYSSLSLQSIIFILLDRIITFTRFNTSPLSSLNFSTSISFFSINGTYFALPIISSKYSSKPSSLSLGFYYKNLQ